MINFLTGGAISLISEGIKTFINYKQDKSDKKHELALAEMQMKLARDTKEIEYNIVQESSEKERFKTISSTYKTGIKFVDSINGLIRPLWGVICLFLFVKLTFFAVSIYTNTDSLYNSPQAYDLMTGRIAYFESICDTIVGFFFVKRTFQK